MRIFVKKNIAIIASAIVIFSMHGCAADGSVDPNFAAFMSGLGQAAGQMNNSMNSNRGVICSQTPGGYYCR